LAGVNPETARQRIAKLEAAGLVTVNGVVKTANGAHATP
jgi:Mn-dependent DtxR family transcriptional regulator